MSKLTKQTIQDKINAAVKAVGQQKLKINKATNRSSKENLQSQLILLQSTADYWRAVKRMVHNEEAQ